MIVHLVPTVPPALNGLADYCFKLSQNWPDVNETWACLSVTIPNGAHELWPQATFITFEASEKSLLSALQLLPIDILIVHYVNYAYHPQGTPTWLPTALATWKKTHPATRLVVMFHELWAGGALWRRSFWVRPVAKTIVTDLAALSNHWVTSCQYYFDEILKVGGDPNRGEVIPVATNIEPLEPVDFERVWPLCARRKLSVAIFGLASTRNTALATHWKLLRALHQADLVECFSLFGQSPQNPAQLGLENTLIGKIGGHPQWRRSYDLIPAQVSRLLVNQDVGIVKETVPLLTKSGVFAALCSHGVLPICATSKSSEKEEDDKPFIINRNVRGCLIALQNQETIKTKKKKLQLLAATSLNWDSVAKSWHQHLRNQR